MNGSALLAAGMAFSILPGIATAQALNTSGGAKFIKSGEPAFKSVPARRRKGNACHTILLDAFQFCPGNSDWIRESPYRPHEMEPGKTPPTALYNMGAGRTGALSAIVMAKDASGALDLPQVVAVVNEHVFDPGPRGDRHRGNAIRQTLSPEGRLTGFAHVTTDDEAAFVLLQVSLLYLPQGLAIIETSERIADFDQNFAITPQQQAFHDAFVGATSFTPNTSAGQ